MRVSPRLVVSAALLLHAHWAVAATPVPGAATVASTTSPLAASVADAVPETVAAAQTVQVRVYRSPDVSNEALRTALSVAKSTFAAASIAVDWQVCGTSNCSTPPSAAERLVRLVRAPRGLRDVRCLGDALIDTDKGVGVLATVYVDRVLALARRLAVDQPTLIGRTIAHEIGHLLLATSTHSTAGLMRELWSPDELQAGRADDWVFQPLEATSIRQRLGGAPARGNAL